MMTLMLKDLRQTFWPALLAVIFLLTPPLACLSFQFSEHGLRTEAGVNTRNELAASFVVGAVGSLLASSSIAGVSFARERRERTAELLATLPLARWKVFVSKAAAALAVTLAPLLAGLAAGAFAAPGSILGDLRHNLHRGSSVCWAAAMVAAVWLLLFGVGWCLSSILRSEVLASAVPILLGIVGATMIGVWTEPTPVDGQFWRSEEERELPRFIYPLGAVGAAGLVVGTVVALRRKSP